MKITRFLALTVAFAPMAVMAGMQQSIESQCSGDRACIRNKAEEDTAARAASEYRFISDKSNGLALLVKESCYFGPVAPQNYRHRDFSDIYPAAECERITGELFVDFGKQMKAAEDKQAKAQKEADEKRLEEERKSAAEAEKQRAAIAASGVSVEKAAEMAGEMYQAYRYGGISEMLSMENACWGTLAKQKKANETGAASCSVAALAGAFVEATYARQQRRGSAPAYNGDMFRQRLIGNMAKAGIKEERAQRVLELSTAHQGSVLLGLMNAGMR